jgi:hypothetical protein
MTRWFNELISGRSGRKKRNFFSTSASRGIARAACPDVQIMCKGYSGRRSRAAMHGDQTEAAAGDERSENAPGAGGRSGHRGVGG